MSPWPQYRSGAVRQVGGTQLELLRRAARSPSGQVMLGDTKSDNARWCAMKRLVQRGLFERQEFGGDRLGKVIIYAITDAGRDAVKREEGR